ncbi:hypothetical protein Q5691_18775 [Microcoleus sp. w1-18aA5]|uniref:hypothetical protein n=1 Tax=Microcoleus sp. w1-18aA5 TaxID=2818982 RepID=UPI002FD3B4AF
MFRRLLIALASLHSDRFANSGSHVLEFQVVASFPVEWAAIAVNANQPLFIHQVFGVAELQYESLWDWNILKFEVVDQQSN